MLQFHPTYRFFMLALAVLTLAPARVLAVEPVLDMFGFDLDSSAAELRDWLAREGFEPTKTKTPRAEAYLRQDGSAGQAIGFVPAERGLDDLFVNQNGITISVDDAVARIEAKYGEPHERQTAGRGYRLSYEQSGSGKSGQMVWVVQRGFVGVELISSGDSSPSENFGKKLLDEVLASLWTWRLAILATIGGGVVLFLLHRVLPVRARRFVSNVLQAVLYPVMQALGFLGSRLFTLIFGIILIPLFVFSGCAAIVSATEQGTSWLWVIPWLIGAILAIESRDSDEFRYVILADLIFAATAVGVLVQLSLGGNG